MIAIETKFIGATNYRPARIVATTANGQRLVMLVSAAEDAEGNNSHGEPIHRVVAQALADQMNWPGTLHGGGTKRGYVFVFEDKDATRRAKLKARLNTRS